MGSILLWAKTLSSCIKLLTRFTSKTRYLRTPPSFPYLRLTTHLKFLLALFQIKALKHLTPFMEFSEYYICQTVLLRCPLPVILNILFVGKYLLVITSKTLISTLQAHKFWKITSVAAFQLPSGRAQTSTSEQVDVELLASILASCNLGHLYYSTSYDITHSLQMNCQNDEKLRDDRYWFNKHLLKDFIGNSSVKDWIIKVSW